MKRINFINTTFLAVPFPIALASGAQAAPNAIAGVDIPRTALAVEAANISRSALPPAIFNHCVRTFVFAELIARAKGLDHDAELVYVASVLHDTGLSPAHMSEKERFEVDGARVAKALLEKHAVPAARRELVWDAITLHDSGGLARWKAPEVALVNAGVVADFGGSQDVLGRADIVALLQAVPRTGFIAEFLPAVAEVAKRKPNATGNCFVTDVGYRLVPGFQLDNFCDEVKTDPFAGYS